MTNFTDQFDSVVMLTWSDWKTEPRSNRYHYASRFSRDLRVYFVQPDLPPLTGSVESTELANVTIIHAGSQYGRPQSLYLESILAGLGVKRPLIWIYNVFFDDFILRQTNCLLVYHATEDYLRPSEEVFFLGDMAPILKGFERIIPHLDLLVSVALPIRDNFIASGGYTGREIFIPNGCDNAFWLGQRAHEYSAPTSGRPIAFYQGAINSRLDYGLLAGMVDAAPDWDFWFCGRAAESPGWAALLKRANVRYLGALALEDVAQAARSASVGIAPFVDQPYMRISVNLKYYEYVACGLPVVSSPNDALLDRPDLFEIAAMPAEFVAALRRLAPTRADTTLVQHRLAAAAEQSYEKKFAQVRGEIAELYKWLAERHCVLNVLVVCAHYLNHAELEALEKLKKASRHNIFFFVAVPGSEKFLDFDMAWFDAVAVSRSASHLLESLSTAPLREAVASYLGTVIEFNVATGDAPRVGTGNRPRVNSARELDAVLDLQAVKPPRCPLVEVHLEAGIAAGQTDTSIRIAPNDVRKMVRPKDGAIYASTKANVGVAAMLSKSLPAQTPSLRRRAMRGGLRIALGFWEKLPRGFRTVVASCVPAPLRNWLKLRGAWPALY